MPHFFQQKQVVEKYELLFVI